MLDLFGYTPRDFGPLSNGPARFVLAGIFLSAPVAMEAVSGCSAATEFPDLVPKEFRQLLVEESDSTPVLLSSDLTLQEIAIDPLGATGAVPWTVFVSTLNVRTEPSTRGGSGTVVGGLPQGESVFGTYYIVQESDEEWLEIEFNGEVRYISRTGVTRPHPQNIEQIDRYANLLVNREIVNRWWGVPMDYEPTDLVEVPPEHTNNIEGREYLLRAQARDAAVAMIDAARAQGLDFRVASPYRSGERQRQLYQNAVNNNLAQRSSAPPGHSEHQLGTCTDFYNPGTGRFLRNTDEQYLWLTANAGAFGFVQSYKAGNTEETGYIEEPWHWRYLPVEAGIQAVKADPGNFGLHSESELAASRLAGQEDVLGNPDAFGLFTEESIADLNLGGLMIEKTDTGAGIEFIIQISDDLLSWRTHEAIYRTIEMDAGKSFLRVRALPAPPPEMP